MFLDQDFHSSYSSGLCYIRVSVRGMFDTNEQHKKIHKHLARNQTNAKIVTKIFGTSEHNNYLINSHIDSHLLNSICIHFTKLHINENISLSMGSPH